MSALLAGLTILMLGDSHMARPDYLISSLHDDLLHKGAQVASYGVCGVAAGEWMVKTVHNCGGARRLNNGAVQELSGEQAATIPLPQLIKSHKPNLIVVVSGDTMAAYGRSELSKVWVWQQVSTLTKGIKASGISCVWIGPPRGEDGGQFGKTYARTREMSAYLTEIVAPCTYIDSLAMSKKSQWQTIDGQHFDAAGYKSWGNAIARAMTRPDVLKTFGR